MYVPTLALQILEHNEAKTDAADKVNLKGILVGNGVTGEGSIPDDVGMKQDTEFFFGHALYNATLHDAIVSACGDYKTISTECDNLIGEMHDTIGKINV